MIMNKRHGLLPSIFGAFCLLIFCASASRAELQWVTGGAPESAPVTTTSNGIKDTPEETGAWTGETGNCDWVMCHLTTCTKVVNNYPADSVNFFYPGQNHEISYFAYFLMKPTTRIHSATVDWYNVSGNRIGRQEYEFRVGFTERLLTLGNENYQWFMVTSTLDLDRPNNEAHQTGLPRDPGMYTVQLKIDNRLAGITFFYVREADKNAKPVSTSNTQAPSGESSGLKVPSDAGGLSTGKVTPPSSTAPALLPLATPMSSVPFAKPNPVDTKK
jgi:hypothetical protein